MVKKAAHATPNYLLRAARKERGWTQQQVADRIGAPLSLNISRWENGTAFPSAYHIEKLTHLFGKSLQELGLSQLADQAQVECPLQTIPSLQTSSKPLREVKQQEATNHDATIPNLTLWPFLSLPPSISPSPPSNLPVQLTRLIGRESEVAMASTLLRAQEIRLLTFVGSAGVGKTSLALQVAAQMPDAFADGVFFVSLAAIRDPQLLVPTLAHCVGLIQRTNQPLLDMLKIALQEKHLLLVLDNFEQIITAAPLLSELLSACRTLKLLVTSREVLRLRSEQLLVVSPLALPDVHQLPATQHLANYPAIDLFVQRVQALQPDFQLKESNARVIAEICIRLDGLPLALELAAARLKVLSPQALLAALSHRLDVLTKGARDLPERQQTLRKTIEWSYELLSMPEQQLFRRFSIFVGGCTTEALVALASAGGSGTDQILDTLTALVDKSLVQRRESTEEETRFTMLETIREYGLECLAESEELALTQQAHAAFYLAFAQMADAGIWTSQQIMWIEQFEWEQDNVRAAMFHLLAQADQKQDIEDALRLGIALERFWNIRGYWSEGLTLLTRILSISQGMQIPLRAKVLIAATNFASQLGLYNQAQLLAEQSLLLCSQLEDARGIARSLFMLFRLAALKGELATARAFAEESLAIRRGLGDRAFLAAGLINLAEVLTFQEEYERALTLLEESVGMLRGLGNTWVLAQALHSWARAIFLAQGDLTVVRTLFEESHRLFQEVGDKQGLADSYHVLAGVVLQQGEGALAVCYIEQALQYYQQMGQRSRIAEARGFLARELAAQGDNATAQAIYEEGLALCLELGIDKTHEAVFHQEGLVTDVAAFHLEGLAEVVARQGALVWAARLWGAARTLRETFGTHIPPVYRSAYERAVAHARAQLGEPSFTSAWSQGCSMTPAQVLFAREPEPMSFPVSTLPSRSPQEQSSPTYPDGLTVREVEVLRLVAQGLRNAEIADCLIISQLTVKAHMRSLYNKLNISSRVAATHYALEHRLL